MSTVENDCELEIFHDWQRQLSSNLVKPIIIIIIIIDYHYSQELIKESTPVISHDHYGLFMIIISIEYVHSTVWALRNGTKGNATLM